MNTPTPQPHPLPPDAIRLTKLVRADRQRVYDAWTDPEQLRRWWSVDPQLTGCEVHAVPEAGGELRLVMHMAQGSCTGTGRFLELSPPDRIVFSLRFDMGPTADPTTVTVELFDAENPFDDGPATEVVLTQSGLTTAHARSESTGGWWPSLRALGHHARGVDPWQALHHQPKPDWA